MKVDHIKYYASVIKELLKGNVLARGVEDGARKIMRIEKSPNNIRFPRNILVPKTITYDDEERILYRANFDSLYDLYQYLKEKQGFKGFDNSQMGQLLNNMLSQADPNYMNNPDIKWNFTKFVINRQGEVVARFEPTEDMNAVEECIKSLL